jgi:uncharacterized membrane protein YbaN (DUF454 family)
MDIRKALLIFTGTVCVALGVLGMFLPLLPTTVFLLMAAYCYSLRTVSHLAADQSLVRSLHKQLQKWKGDLAPSKDLHYLRPLGIDRR